MNALDYPIARRPDATEQAVLNGVMRRGHRVLRILAWGGGPLLSVVFAVSAWGVLSQGGLSGGVSGAAVGVIAINAVAQPAIWWAALRFVPRARQRLVGVDTPMRQLDGVLDQHVLGTGSGTMTLKLGGVRVLVPKHWPETYGLVRALVFVPHPKGRGHALVVEMEHLDGTEQPSILSVADDVRAGRVDADAVLYRDRSTGLDRTPPVP